MNVVEAFDYLCETIYFARPYYDDDNRIITFDVDFRNAIDIFPIKDKMGEIVWICEYGSWALKDKCYYHDYPNDITGTSYEDCIIQLAERIYDKIGEDLLLDYCEMEDGEFKIGKDGYLKDFPKVIWNNDKILDRIRGFENV